MTISLDKLRRDARRLQKSHAAGEPVAQERLRLHPPRQDGRALRLADYLHVVAQENNFASWPALKLVAETIGLDRAAKRQRLLVAQAQGQVDVVATLLADTPDLADGVLGLHIGLFDLPAVRAALENDPTLATQPLGPRLPILHLCFSRWLKKRPELEADMLAIADLLLENGADVNSALVGFQGSREPLSALYGAIGHADNMPLARWLLDHGANPNDGESLYHATELGHHEGLRMLLDHGADPKGTNALLRAMDFHDHAAVELLIAHGARVDDFDPTHVGGEAPWTAPALHQAGRRMCDVRMIDILMRAGADPAAMWQGASAYGYARVFGNTALARAIEAAGTVPDLNREERLMARAAEGQESPGEFINPDKLPEAYRNIIRQILHLPGKLDHVKRLVALGVEYDRPDTEGLTPVQLAGWEGLPEVLDYFLRLMPDLTHVNRYGGTLLTTILHGADNNPNRAERDHIECLRLVLEHGLALPRAVLNNVANDDIAAYLRDWAARYPGQVD